jgi:hypothetical protein
MFCQTNRFSAVICMGNGTPSDKLPLSPVEALAREKPAQLMAQLLAIWPHVQQALKAGHTLRQIHKRLNMAGLPISYKLFVIYRGRIERRKREAARPMSQVVAGVSQIAAQPAGPPNDRSTPAFDPLANLREHEQKRVVWQYPTGPPDESKLF